MKDKLNKIQDKKSLYSKDMSESMLRFDLKAEAKKPSSLFMKIKLKNTISILKYAEHPFCRGNRRETCNYT